MNTPTSDPQRPRRRDITRRRWLDSASLLSLVAALGLIFATSLLGARGLQQPSPALAGLALVRGTPTPDPTATVRPTITSTPTATPTSTPSPLTVAIIVGHRNNDSGAICEGGPYDGLQEVQVTTGVYEKLAKRLRADGYQVLDLDEFDPRLDGLTADALVSMHVDSCVDWEGTTGFKVARADYSAIPEVEDRFVGCMEGEYKAATGLETHPGSITHNMRLYHAFRRIDPNTPAVIIELGFLFYDHDLLTGEQERVATGVAEGIDCFLGKGATAP